MGNCESRIGEPTVVLACYGVRTPFIASVYRMVSPHLK
jgi:hypothetical protein